MDINVYNIILIILVAFRGYFFICRYVHMTLYTVPRILGFGFSLIPIRFVLKCRHISGNSKKLPFIE